ncbi:MAG: Lrp/AsnC ligand binding domain-containing protein [Bacteroidota bacterium]|nr:Lrp/AsnC ligand binding domain-containing protein [Bacteroidota bacterium]
MSKNHKIDSTDRKIIRMLLENARMPFLEVARACGMSGAAIHQRVNKLENAGIIAGSRIKLSPTSMGYNTCAFVGVFLDQARMYHSVIKEMEKIPEIVECHYTTGNYAIFLKIYCKNNQDLMNVLNGQIQKISGISRTETFISLEQEISRELLP